MGKACGSLSMRSPSSSVTMRAAAGPRATRYLLKERLVCRGVTWGERTSALAGRWRRGAVPRGH